MTKGEMLSEPEVKGIEMRGNLTLRLIGVIITIFVLIITLKPSLIKDNLMIAFQIVLSIPLLISSHFFNVRHIRHGRDYGFGPMSSVCFLLGYGFLINVVGIIFSVIVSKYAGLVFFVINILLSFIYSYVVLRADREKFWRRVKRDAFFALLVICLGIIPSWLL